MMNENLDLAKNINELRRLLKDVRPLVHCITNPISINQCANTILAAGARPICAEHPKEAAEITSSAGAVMLNLGNITDVRMESMRISANEARKNGIRFVLDICGAACLKNRRFYAENMIKAFHPTVVKGNYSEIKALYQKDYQSSGVDADSSLVVDEIAEIAKKLAEEINKSTPERNNRTTVLVSGKTDIVTDGENICFVKNGTPQLASITGTGCMQGALCSAFLSVADGFDAAVAASVMFGICGELSETDKGSGTFQVNLLDNLSTIKDEDIVTKLKVE